MSGGNGKLDAQADAVEVQGTPGWAEDAPRAVVQALAENDASLAQVLRLLGRMEREGTLQELSDLLALVKLVKGALTDSMVIGMARRVEGLAAVATDPVLDDLIKRVPGALRAAEVEAARALEEPPGLMAMLKQLRDPQVRSGLTFVLSLAKHLAPGAPRMGEVDDAG